MQASIVNKLARQTLGIFDLLWCRKVEREPCVFTLRRLAANVAANRLHRHLAETEPNSGTLASLSGGIEAFENLLVDDRGNSQPRVVH